MKKVLALVLSCLMLVVALAGCGSSSNDKKDGLETVTEGKLTMATNATFPPYEYYEGKKVIGIDAEIAGEIAKKLNLELEIADIEFDSIVPGVQSGKYDMGMAGMTVTPERKNSVNFSDSYATGIQKVIVTKDSEIKTLDDIKGKNIGVQTSTTGDLYATDDYGADHVKKFDSGNAAVNALKVGKVDCVIIDNEPAKAYVKANGSALKILDTDYAVEDYAICFSKDNTELQKKVNEALNELKKDGTVQKIVDKYIKAD
nr:basic amino acid ABC transporter substrate-binding protein [uncultured Ruminococcus sp.]